MENPFYSLSTDPVRLQQDSLDLTVSNSLIILTDRIDPEAYNTINVSKVGSLERPESAIIGKMLINGEEKIGDFIHLDPGEYIVHPPAWLYPRLVQHYMENRRIAFNEGLIRIEEGKIGWLRWDQLSPFREDLTVKGDKLCVRHPISFIKGLKGVAYQVSATTGALVVILPKKEKNSYVRAERREHYWVQVREYRADDGKWFGSPKDYMAIFNNLPAGIYIITHANSRLEVSVYPYEVTYCDWTTFPS
jgi:hypothetical protein